MDNLQYLLLQLANMGRPMTPDRTLELVFERNTPKSPLVAYAKVVVGLDFELGQTHLTCWEARRDTDAATYLGKLVVEQVPARGGFTFMVRGNSNNEHFPDIPYRSNVPVPFGLDELHTRMVKVYPRPAYQLVGQMAGIAMYGQDLFTFVPALMEQIA